MKLHHVAITVKDLATSISFYEGLFDFKEVKRFRREDFGATGCFLQGENMIIELWQFDKFEMGAREDLSITGIKHIAFTHDDLETFHNVLTEKGIVCSSIEKGKSGALYFFFSDPDLNQIEIYKPNI